MASIIHQLRGILQGTETLEERLCDTRESQTELDLIADKFRALANTIGKKTQSFKPVQQNEIWEKSKDRRDKVENTLTNVFTQKKLPDTSTTKVKFNLHQTGECVMVSMRQCLPQ